MSNFQLSKLAVAAFIILMGIGAVVHAAGKNSSGIPMEEKSGNCDININGKCYKVPPGSTVSADSEGVKINGTPVTQLNPNDINVLNIVINGTVTKIDGSINVVTVNGDAGSVQTTNGNVTVQKNVKGPVTTVNGTIEIGGDVSGSISTVNGNVDHQLKK